MTDLLTENARLRAALAYMVNHAEWREENDGVYWEATKIARAALATPAPDAVQEAARVPEIAALAGAVAVKPLAWEASAKSGYEQANCNLGQYQIMWLGEFECWQLFCPARHGQRWDTCFTRFARKDDAKAAAQADYEARIRAALIPAHEATSALDAVKQAEYARGLRDAAARAYEVAHNTNDISQIRDAILAMIPKEITESDS